MVFSIIKQSIDIRLSFEHTPKINADVECAAAIGMLAKLYGISVPERNDDLLLMQNALKEQTKALPATDKIRRLEDILYAYEPKEPLNDEKYELLVYSYQHTERDT